MKYLYGIVGSLLWVFGLPFLYAKLFISAVRDGSLQLPSDGDSLGIPIFSFFIVNTLFFAVCVVVYFSIKWFRSNEIYKIGFLWGIIVGISGALYYFS